MKGNSLRRNSLSSKANRGEGTPFLDNNFRNYVGKLSFVYNTLSIIIFKKVGFKLRTKDTNRW